MLRLTSSDTFTTLSSVNGAYGRRPVGGLFADASGALSGTTHQGGAANFGMLLRFTATGFEVGGGSSVPAPQNWVMPIFGFGMVGAASRRRRALTA